MFRRNPFYSLFSPAGDGADGGAPAAAPAVAPAAASVLGAAAAAPAAAAGEKPAGEKPAGEKPAGEKPAEVAVADQKAWLLSKAPDDAAKKALEGKTEEEVKALYKDGKEAEAKLAENPTVEKYLKDVKLPEGFKLDETVSKDFYTLMSKYKIPVSDIQSFMDKYSKQQMDAASAPQKLWDKTQSDWKTAVSSDPEIGGDKLAENLGHAARFIDTLPNAAELRKALDYTGAGNNPHIVRAFVAVGKALAEGKVVLGAPPKGGNKSAAQTLYPGGASGVAS